MPAVRLAADGAHRPVSRHRRARSAAPSRPALGAAAGGDQLARRGGAGRHRRRHRPGCRQRAGANNAAVAAGGVQRYDISYTRCMYAHGNAVQAPPTGYAAYPAYPCPRQPLSLSAITRGYPIPSVAIGLVGAGGAAVGAAGRRWLGTRRGLGRRRVGAAVARRLGRAAVGTVTERGSRSRHQLDEIAGDLCAAFVGADALANFPSGPIGCRTELWSIA